MFDLTGSRAALRRTSAAGVLAIVLATLVSSAVPAAAEASATGVVSGKLVTPFPLGGRAGATVQLVRLDTARVVKAVRATRTGYRLSAPPGVYVASGYAAHLGRRVAAEGYSRAFRLAGTMRLDLRLTATRRAARALASAETPSASGPAVGLGTPILLPGVGDLSWMLGTELMNADRPCAVDFIAENPGFREARRRELKLSRSGPVDPATRVQDRAIKPSLRVAGAARMAGGTLTVTLFLLDTKTGRLVATETQTGPATDWSRFEGTIRRVARKLASHLCSQFPIRYRVLAATLETRTDASKASGTGICDPVGGVSGSVDFSVRLRAPVETGEIDQMLGTLQGSVIVKASGGWTNHLVRGCRITTSGLEPCSARGPDVSIADQLIGFRVSGSEGAGTAELLWDIPDPSVGSFTNSADLCFVFVAAGLPVEARKQTVPLDRLTSRAPVTLTFGGRKELKQPGPGEPALVTYSWSYSLTLQRRP